MYSFIPDFYLWTLINSLCLEYTLYLCRYVFGCLEHVKGDNQKKFRVHVHSFILDEAVCGILYHCINNNHISF